VVSNPPYVTETELAGLQPEVRDYEPRLALSGQSGATGETGTDLYPRLFEQAHAVLEPGGWALVEIGLGQVDIVVDAARRAGFIDVTAIDDFAGIPRVVFGHKP
jgi:release factor glutamine methyltransferase